MASRGSQGSRRSHSFISYLFCSSCKPNCANWCGNIDCGLVDVLVGWIGYFRDFGPVTCWKGRCVTFLEIRNHFLEGKNFGNKNFRFVSKKKYHCRSSPCSMLWGKSVPWFFTPRWWGSTVGMNSYRWKICRGCFREPIEESLWINRDFMECHHQGFVAKVARVDKWDHVTRTLSSENLVC